MAKPRSALTVIVSISVTGIIVCRYIRCHLIGIGRIIARRCKCLDTPRLTRRRVDTRVGIGIGRRGSRVILLGMRVAQEHRHRVRELELEASTDRPVLICGGIVVFVHAGYDISEKPLLWVYSSLDIHGHDPDAPRRIGLILLGVKPGIGHLPSACGSVLGSGVDTRIAPPVVLWPNSVPCGPLRTWMLVTLGNWKSPAIGLGE